MTINPCALLPFTIGQTVYLNKCGFEMIVKGFLLQNNILQIEVALAEAPDGSLWRFNVDTLVATQNASKSVTKIYRTRNNQPIGLMIGRKHA